MRFLARLFLSLVFITVSTIPIFSLPQAIMAADTGWVSPSASDGTGFTSPDNAFLSDNVYATVNANGVTQRYMDLDIPAIPTGATVTGIEVRVEARSSSSSGTNRNFNTDLSYNAGANWSSIINTSNYGTADTTATIGGVNNTWGWTWTPGDFTNANFRIRLTSNRSSNITLSLDSVQVRVTYSEPTTPTIVTDAATAISSTGATLNGNVTSLGAAANATVYFEWGPTTTYGSVTGNQLLTAPVTFWSILSGLTPNTTYHYRVRISGDSVFLGSDAVFTTTTSALAAVTEAASNVTESSVTLSGTLSGTGTSPNVTISFEYGPTTAYGSETTSQVMTAPGAFGAELPGLAPVTTYHFRVKAAGAGSETVYGADRMFTTLAAPAPVTGWWNTGWSRRANVTVTENSAASLTNYQIKVTVPYDSDMRPDFGDIRFIDGDGITELAYWRNSFAASASAVFWVKVPSIPASRSRTIYIYYGNPSAATKSDIHATFIWGDDFENTTWTAANIFQVNYENTSGGNSTQYIENGAYHQSGPAQSEPIAEIREGAALKIFPTSYTAEVDFNPVTKNGGIFINPCYASVSDKYENLIDLDYDTAVLNKVVDDIWSSLSTAPTGTTVTAGTWRKLTAVLTREGNTNRLKIGLNDNIFVNTTDASLTTPSLAFLTYDHEAAFHCAYDNFRVRQYAAVEPAAVIGAETGVTAVTTGAASGVGFTAATLHGSLVIQTEAGGFQISFEYGPDTSYGSSTAAVPMNATVDFSATISDLSPQTIYHFRTKAIGAAATLYGVDQTFTTLSTAPSVTTLAATETNYNSARLNGNLTGTGNATSVQVSFEWGVTTAYGQITPATALPAAGAFSAAVTGLTANTTYHFRTKAVGDGIAYGSDMTFRTAPTPLGVATGEAGNITITGATISGELIGLGNATAATGAFEWGLSAAYTDTTPAQEKTAPGAFNAGLTRLTGNTTYHFRAKATTGEGTHYGLDRTFTTLSLAPSVSTIAATGIDHVSATLNGNLTSMGTSGEVTVAFEYGPTTAYGTQTAAVKQSATGTFSLTLTAALNPNTTYHFRARATGNGLTSFGNDMTFTTQSPPLGVATGEATDVSADAAILSGEVTSLGYGTSANVSFEWGTTTTYGNITSSQPMTAAGTFNEALSGLTPGTAYHHRAKAEGAITAYGDDRVFTTLTQQSAAQPEVTSLSITAVTGTSAVLNGNLKRLGNANVVRVSFEYGLNTAYGAETALTAKNLPGVYSATLSGLTPGTTYHFRARAIGDGTCCGADIAFTTMAAPPAPTGWWNSAWTRKAAVTVTENSGLALTDYQIKVNVPYDSDMQPDFGDVRFVDGSAELAYWRQSYTPGTSAVFWVKVPSVPAGGIKALFVYYGNPAAATGSDIHNTFIWGDDFENATWTAANIHQVNYASPANVTSVQFLENGTYHQSGPGESEPIAEIWEGSALKAFPDSYTAEVEFSPVIRAGGVYITPRYGSVSDKYENLIDMDFNATSVNKVVKNTWSNIGTAPLGFVIEPGAWNKLTTVAAREGAANRLKVFVNDTQLINVTDSELNHPGLAFLTFNFEAPFHCAYDDFRVRQYAAVEPGTVVGAEIEFCSVATGTAVNITSNTATLNGVLNMLGTSPIQVAFEWGFDQTYGFTAAGQTLDAPGNFSVTLAGLAPNTTYHYRAKGTGSMAFHGADATFTTTNTSIVRSFPERVQHGQNFTVTVSFKATADNFNSVGFTDIIPTGWIVTPIDGGCVPEVMMSNAQDNKIDYIWAGPYPGGTPFTVAYQVQVPAETIPGFFTINGAIEYRIGNGSPVVTGIPETPKVNIVPGAKISGMALEVYGIILNDVTVTIDGNATTTCDAEGCWSLIAPTLGDHTITAARPGFRTETQVINIADTAGLYTLNFRGESGLVPNAPNLSYVLTCINRWKFPPADGTGVGLSKVLSVLNAWKFPR